MSKLEWTEVNGRLISVPREGVVVTACKVSDSASWAIMVEGVRKKHGICKELEAAKDAAAREVEVYLRG